MNLATALGLNVNKEMTEALLLLIPVLPLLGSMLVFFITNRSKKFHKFSGPLATLASFGAFLVVLSLYCKLCHQGLDSLVITAWQWLEVGNLSLDFSFRFDRLSAVMSLVVTGVGTLIHLYAVGYSQNIIRE